MISTKHDSQSPILVRRIAPDELTRATDVWYRRLVSSLSYLRPEQLRSEGEYRSFFRDIVAARRELWIAQLAGSIVGVLALEGNEVDRLYVAPEAQGRGVGTALLDRAKSLHPRGLTLVTHQRNTRARRFYEGHGFEPCGFGVSPAPESEPDVTYVWNGAAGRS